MWEGGIKKRHKSARSYTQLERIAVAFILNTFEFSLWRKKEKTTFSSQQLKPWVLTKIEKTCWINKWQTQHQMVLCIHECLKLQLMLGYDVHSNPYMTMPPASLYYLTHITNVWGCMEILPTHCGAGSVKVNYYRCMRKIWGLVKPHKVNKLQMRLSCCSIYSNTVCNMKKYKRAFSD